MRNLRYKRTRSTRTKRRAFFLAMTLAAGPAVAQQPQYGQAYSRPPLPVNASLGGAIKANPFCGAADESADVRLASGKQSPAVRLKPIGAAIGLHPIANQQPQPATGNPAIVIQTVDNHQVRTNQLVGSRHLPNKNLVDASVDQVRPTVAADQTEVSANDKNDKVEARSSIVLIPPAPRVPHSPVVVPANTPIAARKPMSIPAHKPAPDAPKFRPPNIGSPTLLAVPHSIPSAADVNGQVAAPSEMSIPEVAAPEPADTESRAPIEFSLSDDSPMDLERSLPSNGNADASLTETASDAEGAFASPLDLTPLNSTPLPVPTPEPAVDRFGSRNVDPPVRLTPSEEAVAEQRSDAASQQADRNVDQGRQAQPFAKPVEPFVIDEESSLAEAEDRNPHPSRKAVTSTRVKEVLPPHLGQARPSGVKEVQPPRFNGTPAPRLVKARSPRLVVADPPRLTDVQSERQNARETEKTTSSELKKKVVYGDAATAKPKSSAEPNMHQKRFRPPVAVRQVPLALERMQLKGANDDAGPTVKSVPMPSLSASESQADMPDLTGSKLTPLYMSRTQIRSLTIGGQVSRVKVADQNICQAFSAGPNELKLIGTGNGVTRLVVWAEVDNAAPRMRAFEIHVDDTVATSGENVDKRTKILNASLYKMFPGCNVEVRRQDNQLLVVGDCDSQESATKIVRIVRKTCLIPVRDELRIR